MKPADCPKYDTCSVPLCPLDAKWRARAVMSDEAVCPYLLELDKPGDPIARFAGRYDDFVIAAAVKLRDDLNREAHPRYAFLPARIARSAGTPTMIEQEARRKAQGEALAKQRYATVQDRNVSSEPPADVSEHVGGGPA